MKYTAQSEGEIDRADLIPSGAYLADVIKATDGAGKTSGNEMITLELQVRDKRKTKIWDWLVAMDHPMCKRKIRHFCESAAILEKYETSELMGKDCLGRLVLVEVEVQDAKGGYAAKNVAADYLAHNGEQPGPAKDVKDDDIPF